jgi:two-component system cell cycle sensor histidine kinase/response regulator CckA
MILSRMGGYQVIEASNGVEALQKYEEHAKDITLVVTDCVMPGMSGPELIKQLKLLNPQLKIVCMSGYSRSALPASLVFLPKPLTPASLLSKVQEAIAAV